MGDDVAFDDRKFNPGVIQYNRSSPEVYGGIMKDYTGQNLTLHNFLAVLTEIGNKTLSSRVLLEALYQNHVMKKYESMGQLALRFFFFPMLFRTCKLSKSDIKNGPTSSLHAKIVYHVFYRYLQRFSWSEDSAGISAREKDKRKKVSTTHLEHLPGVGYS
ncbi:hypothetical protein E3N88_13774 [Mikania micrantha]|uniref:Uncharacterized protein n=1 Tax=Mikania micrantha TaxID=192012 RepID=A0A5N6NZJ7_9ASTR|nr:hypothetical protein E3N88_13774 [Mikania micrantha]